jgi:hypothetical protein
MINFYDMRNTGTALYFLVEVKAFGNLFAARISKQVKLKKVNLTWHNYRILQILVVQDGNCIYEGRCLEICFCTNHI